MVFVLSRVVVAGITGNPSYAEFASKLWLFAFMSTIDDYRSKGPSFSFAYQFVAARAGLSSYYRPVGHLVRGIVDAKENRKRS